MKRFSILLLLAALAGILSACGGGGSQGSAETADSSGGLKQVTLTLDWYPNADHAGIYTARSQGFFEDEGLDVKIQQPSDPSTVLQLVAAGRSEFGVSYENEMTSAATKDVPVQSVMAIVEEPLNSIISLKGSNITKPEDLAGKKVGYAGQTFGSAVIDTVLREAGKDPSSVQKINVGYDLRPALTSKRVDAIVDAYWNIEAVELAQRGFETNVIKLPSVGVPNYDELVLATGDSYAKNNPDTVRRFVAALARGQKYAMGHPDVAQKAILNANEQLEPKLVEKTVKLTLPTFDSAGRVGYQDPDEWEAYIDWAVENEVLPKPVAVKDAMTNEYLPKGGSS